MIDNVYPVTSGDLRAWIGDLLSVPCSFRAYEGPDALIAALLRAALDESNSDYQRYLFIDSLKVRVGYCFECGSKLTDYGWGQSCTCQMDD